jgi:hypothetical protein
MAQQHTLTAILHREEDMWVANCPEVGTVPGENDRGRGSGIERSHGAVLGRVSDAAAGQGVGDHVRGHVCLRYRRFLVMK